MRSKVAKSVIASSVAFIMGNLQAMALTPVSLRSINNNGYQGRSIATNNDHLGVANRQSSRALPKPSSFVVSTSSLGLYHRRHGTDTRNPRNPMLGNNVSTNAGRNHLSNRPRNERRPSSSLVALAASMAPISQSNLAVSIDRPLLSFDTYRTPPTSSFWPSILAVLLSDVFKTAVVAFLLAAGVSLMARCLAGSGSSGHKTHGDQSRNALSALSTFKDRIVSAVSSILPSLSSTPKKDHVLPTPMPFEGDGGWGKCTLRSKKKMGASSFTLYEFALPRPEYTLPLALGQQLDFCCLSLEDDIVKGSFYPYVVDDDGKGVVRLVVPDKDAEGSAAQAGVGSSKFIEVLQNELRPGDEVAIKPGKSTLHYKGEHVPVTDMVYIASGSGIVPIVDQVKAIVPKGSSSVKVTTVVWINDNRGDFDIAMDELENEYMKHSTKLAVSCILDDVMNNPMEKNVEVEEAVPYFNAGSMAVIAGPKRFSEKVKSYLMRKGYPENCICVLS